VVFRKAIGNQAKGERPRVNGEKNGAIHHRSSLPKEKKARCKKRCKKAEEGRTRKDVQKKTPRVGQAEGKLLEHSLKERRSKNPANVKKSPWESTWETCPCEVNIGRALAKKKDS